MSAHLLSESDGLLALEPAWWALFHRCSSASPFRSPAWLLPWWRTFAPGPLRTVAVWRGADLVGLAPFYLEEASRRLLPLGIGISDDLDMVAVPGQEADVGAVALDALRACPDWDLVSFEELGPGATALAWPVPADCNEDRVEQSLCPVLSWGDPTPGIEAVVPPAKLRKLRMARHRVERRGGTIETAGAGTACEHLDALFRLHAARWESRGEAGVLAEPTVQAFHGAAVPRLAAAGLLHATLLRIDGQVAGVFHGLRRGAVIYAYLGGFDPAFAFESPGTVLMGHAIDTLMMEGSGTLNLLRGQEPYKYGWGAIDRPNLRRTLWRSAPP